MSVATSERSRATSECSSTGPPQCGQTWFVVSRVTTLASARLATAIPPGSAAPAARTPQPIPRNGNVTCRADWRQYRVSLVQGIVIFALAVVALPAVVSAAGDPRKCDPTRTDIAEHCAGTAATLAFRRHMTRLMHTRVIFTSQIRCDPAAATLLVWRCAFGYRYADGVATVTFRALSAGWYTRVTVKCNTAFTPRTACHEPTPLETGD